MRFLAAIRRTRQYHCSAIPPSFKLPSDLLKGRGRAHQNTFPDPPRRCSNLPLMRTLEDNKFRRPALSEVVVTVSSTGGGGVGKGTCEHESVLNEVFDGIGEDKGGRELLVLLEEHG